MTTRIRCKHCNTSTLSTSDVARMAGWRMFKGVSFTGKPLDDVACPMCAGTAKEPVRGWLVRCNTCDWTSDDPFYDDVDDEALDAKGAREVAADHECEPSVQIQPPGDKVWHDPHTFNDDGSPCDQKPAAGMTAGTFNLATPETFGSRVKS